MKGREERRRGGEEERRRGGEEESCDSNNVLATIITSAITTSGDRRVRTGEILGITCTISGLLGPVDVTWIDPEGMKIPNHQSTGYAVTDGETFLFWRSSSYHYAYKSSQGCFNQFCSDLQMLDDVNS